MNYPLRGRAGVRAVAVLLFVLAGTAAFFGVFYCGLFWETLFGEDDLTYFQPYYTVRNDFDCSLMQIMEYRQRDKLTYLEQRELDELQAALAPEVTNFRYIVRDNATGEILLSSLGPDSLNHAWDIKRHKFQIYYGDFSVEPDPDMEFGPSGESDCRFALETGIEAGVPVQDAFQRAVSLYSNGNALWCYVTAGLLLAALGLLVFLMCCAGHRRDCPEIVLTWQDRIPYDLYFCVMAAAVSVLIASSVTALLYALRNLQAGPQQRFFLFITGVTVATGFGLTAAGMMSTAARVKAGTLLQNTLTWKSAAWFVRTGRSLWRGTVAFASTLFSHWPLTGRVVLGDLLFLGLKVLLLAGMMFRGVVWFYLALLLLLNGAVLFILCRWTLAWSGLREGTRAIVSGHPDAVLDTGKMALFPDLREHAGQLNDLGSAINTAVEARMKSERMKAELITNVSHDLKTPLTSIINYVDLLKKEELDSEKAREYVDILDRKSQRLKKLTEDLVEASKASTGALTVNSERLGVGQLVMQALGEYAEKLANAALTLVPTLPEQEVYVRADGRHLWRVLDNLMGNCVKYAMPGTRVYVDVMSWNGAVIVSIKNISARQLNVPAESLLERFVRGDESRSTEGSGLGLSIARSLTELQGGTFRLDVDGDLFKASVSLPEVA